MKYKSIKVFTPLIALAVVFSVAFPLSAMAKNDKENNKGVEVRIENRVENKIKKLEKKDEAKDKKTRDFESCLKAFGHFISPGWRKHNGDIKINSNCFFPFGIAKKFRTDKGTTTPPVVDTTAPVITSVNAVVTTNRAHITWTTNEKSDSKIYWSISSPVNTVSSTTLKMTETGKVLKHELNITGLNASTTYYAIVSSKDSKGNVGTSSQFSFTTTPIVVKPDLEAPVIRDAVAVVGTSTVKVAWLTNESATGKVYYSTSSPVATSSASFVQDTSLTLSHLLNISGLSTNTTYHMIIESSDTAGNIRTSSTFSATTGI